MASLFERISYLESERDILRVALRYYADGEQDGGRVAQMALTEHELTPVQRYVREQYPNDLFDEVIGALCLELTQLYEREKVLVSRNTELNNEVRGLRQRAQIDGDPWGCMGGLHGD